MEILWKQMLHCAASFSSESLAFRTVQQKRNQTHRGSDITSTVGSGKLSHLFNVLCHHAIFWRSNTLIIRKVTKKKIHRAKYMHVFMHGDLCRAAQMTASYTLPSA